MDKPSNRNLIIVLILAITTVTGAAAVINSLDLEEVRELQARYRTLLESIKTARAESEHLSFSYLSKEEDEASDIGSRIKATLNSIDDALRRGDGAAYLNALRALLGLGEEAYPKAASRVAQMHSDKCIQQILYICSAARERIALMCSEEYEKHQKWALVSEELSDEHRYAVILALGETDTRSHMTEPFRGAVLYRQVIWIGDRWHSLRLAARDHGPGCISVRHGFQLRFVVDLYAFCQNI